MFMGKVTSRKCENAIYVLDEEIKRLRCELTRVREASLVLEDCERNRIINLDEALKQKELEKYHIKMSFDADLAAVLRQVNGNARACTVCPKGLIGLAQECEGLMDAKGVRVKNRPGAMVSYRPAGKVSRSHFGKSITTYVVIRRVQDGWRLVHAERDYCYLNQREFREITVRTAAYEDIIRHATQKFCVRKALGNGTLLEDPVL
ncbi:MAG: hypothetical protein ACSHWZ_18900 [Sulfitobacter sp.]